MSDQAFSPDTVRRLARLARMSVPDQELGKLGAELEKILGHIRALEAVDTDGVPPTMHVSADRLPFRADVVVTGLDRETVLREAPHRATEGFAVPSFVEEG